MVALLMDMSLTLQSPAPEASLKTVNSWFLWGGIVTMLGVATMIAGLAWRRPIVEPQKGPPTSIGGSPAGFEQEATE